VYIQRGLVYQDMGNHQMAIEDFEKAKELEPNYSPSHFYLGVSKLQSRDPRSAREHFDLALKLDDKGENPGIFDGLGSCFHRLGDYENAIDNFKEAIQAEQEKGNINVSFYKNIAQCYSDMNKYNEAISYLETALEENEDDPQVLYKLGLAFFADKKYKKSIKTLKKALKNKPYYTYEPDVFYHIGLAYCRLEKFEKSIFPYSRCIERVPTEVIYIHERAKAYQMIEKHEDAVADFDQVLKRSPRNAHAYFRRAFSLKALKKFSDAANDFEEAKKLDPMNPKLVVNYKKLKGITCIVLCEPGEEKTFE
jgi:tetratricopeptide (TPR) repeat protein